MTNTTRKNVLVVDDEADLRELLTITLGRMNLDAEAVGTVKEAVKALSESEYDLCLTDMNLPDGSGIELVRHISARMPDIPVAVITAYGSMETATEALKDGAYDFIAKPVSLDRLRELVEDGLGIRGTDATLDDDVNQLIGESPAMQKLREQTRKLARSQAPIYISGESGSGKERVARLIHALGPRRSEAFVPVNCGAIPSELMESEFFGHRKGSFTGAYEDRKGLFREASGGTLFLDEVADLPLSMQVKLLRAIQEKSVRPVGESREVNVNVRILCATHRDLTEEVARGNFRQDLFYRLNVIEAHVPPLRERVEDIPLLANHILGRLCREWDLPEPHLTETAWQALKLYSFPGNVRELENVLERALTLADGTEVGEEHLQLPGDNGTEPQVISTTQRPPDQPLEEYLEEIEKEEILKALDATNWNRTAAAGKLGMTFRSLRYRLKKLALDQQEGSE
jgi:two-component system response regulator PilR (NtrC family)